MTPEVLPPPLVSRPAIRCTLRIHTSGPGQRPTPRFSAELELENTSSSPIDIPFDRHPLQHLDLLVTGSDGRIVSEFPYGNLFSPVSEPGTLHLSAGEKFTAPVSLLGNTSKENLATGTYLVTAIYDAGIVHAESAPLTVRV